MSVLKVRGEISLKMANGGEFATVNEKSLDRLSIRRA
jgi:hypothetical protein